MDNLSAYDLWSRDYDGFANPMIAMVDRTLESAPLFVKGLRVLELGCGTGRNLARLLAAGAKSYTGIDGSEGMLEKAREKSEDPRVFWFQADLGQPLALAAGSFDFVLITLVLEHLPAVAPVLKEAARALRPGGRLRILEIHPGLVDAGTQAHFWHEGKEISLECFAHDESEFRAGLAAAGLQALAIDERAPDEELISRLPKLAKHQGRPMLLDVQGEKP